MSPTTLALFVVGLLLLIGGADLLVRGASRLALACGIAPLIIGLTVVAFGTSAPELAVSVRSALASEAGADIALGNVVGSNIFNVLFILGLSALLTPLTVSQQLIRKDVPIMIGISALVLAMAADGRVGRLDGLILFAGIVLYTFFAISQGRKESPEVAAEYAEAFGDAAPKAHRVGWDVTMIIGGLAALVAGSGWLIDGAVVIARGFGVSELVIGLTLIAAGTSLPEVATSVMASLKGERDIAVGNVVGSNIFNLLSVLGLSALVGRRGVAVAPEALRFDLPVMTAVAVACLPVFFTGQRISRWEGGLFLGYYAAYTTYLILASTQHHALPILGRAMLFFVLPLTVLTLIVTVVQQVRSRR